MQPVLRLRRLHPGATVPQYQTAHAAGMDLHACIDQPMRVEPGQIVIVPCGFAMSLPPGYEGQVRARSGLATRHGITLPNSPGTIDADYRGELKVAIINLGRETFVIEHALRIAQLIVAPVAQAVIRETDDLDSGPTHLPHTESKLTPRTRGEGGFGSTGA
ncbi:MAG: dUTP diphosphatase [Phycisphaerales bacterium]|nr:MAG: dUTP diphosphatase [Phycisphaerales bacterium]